MADDPEAAPLLPPPSAPAADSADEDSSSRDFEIELTVRVGTTDHKVRIDRDATCTELEELLVRGPMADARGKRFRFIFGGRVLKRDRSLHEAGVSSAGFVQALVTDAPAPNAPAAATAAGSGGGAVPVPLYPTDAEAGAVPDDPSRRGFGQLRRIGFGDDEVQALRAIFSRELRAHESAAPQREGESTQDRILRLEEEWMALQPPTSEFAVNVQARASGYPGLVGGSVPMAAGDELEPGDGSPADFVWGFLMGFFLGFLMIIWVWGGAMRRRQKLGILCGVMANLSLSIMREGYDDDGTAGTGAGGGVRGASRSDSSPQIGDGVEGVGPSNGGHNLGGLLDGKP